MSTQPEKKENKLNELYEQGKAKGTMTYDEIITKLSTTDIDPDQFDTVLETLEAMGVEVIRDANSAEGPQTPEAAPEIDDIDLSMPEGISIDDPVRMYLKEIGKVPLLSADEEINIAMRMEKGDEAKQMLESGINADGKPLTDEEKKQCQAAIDDGTQAKRLLAEANLQAGHLRQKAQTEIAQEKRQMLTDVRGEISDLAVEIASKVVEREIHKEDHEALVEEFIKNVGEPQ